jgi:hypothetical protein
MAGGGRGGLMWRRRCDPAQTRCDMFGGKGSWKGETDTNGRLWVISRRSFRMVLILIRFDSI